MPPTLEPPRTPPAPPPFARVVGPSRVEPAGHEPGRTGETAARWLWIGAGFVAACLAGFVLPCNFTWFLCALPHEMGHATVGCLLGHPSAPAISLRGEAWTGIAELRPWLVWCVAIGFLAGAGALRRRRGLLVALGATALLVPAIAFTTVADVLIAAGGHVGELAFATWCFSMAWSGGRTDTPQERSACAMAGGLVQFANLKLCFLLMTSASARDVYAQNGSLGLENDYLVLAEDLLHCSLPAVAFGMFALALLPLPLGVLIGWWRERAV